MEEYYFLFALGFIWTVFAIVQDMRFREVANWLNFSLIGFALAYRAFYSVFSEDYMFFLLGLGGYGFFYLLSNGLYYSKAFAGGDAKLLMGYGIILPFSSFIEILYGGVLFVFALFLLGVVWTLIYSLKIALFDKRFIGVFVKRTGEKKYLVLFGLLVAIFLLIINSSFWFVSSAIFLLVFLFVYLLSIDNLLLNKKSYKLLQEGDWILEDIKVGNKVIRKTVHGLSKKDIKILQKARKNIFVKDGAPFTPAFILALLFMLFFFLVLGASFSDLLSLF